MAHKEVLVTDLLKMMLEFLQHRNCLAYASHSDIHTVEGLAERLKPHAGPFRRESFLP